MRGQPGYVRMRWNQLQEPTACLSSLRKTGCALCQMEAGRGAGTSLQVWVSADDVLLGKSKGEWSALGCPSDEHHSGCISQEPTRNWMRSTPPGESPRAAEDAMDGSSLLKAMTLSLYSSCPQPQKQMFAVNKAAGRHLLCLWLTRQNHSDTTWMPQRHNSTAIALAHVSWCTSTWGPAACLWHYSFKTSTEVENVYQERPMTLHVMGTAKTPVAYKGLDGRSKAWSHMPGLPMDTAPCYPCALSAVASTDPPLCHVSSQALRSRKQQGFLGSY